MTTDIAFEEREAERQRGYREKYHRALAEGDKELADAMLRNIAIHVNHERGMNKSACPCGALLCANCGHLGCAHSRSYDAEDSRKYHELVLFGEGDYEQRHWAYERYRAEKEARPGVWTCRECPCTSWRAMPPKALPGAAPAPGPRAHAGPRGTRQQRAIRDAQIRARRAAGEKPRDLAREYGVRRGRIYEILGEGR
jgi:hypothetical protein